MGFTRPPNTSNVSGVTVISKAANGTRNVNEPANQNTDGLRHGRNTANGTEQAKIYLCFASVFLPKKSDRRQRKYIIYIISAAMNSFQKMSGRRRKFIISHSPTIRPDTVVYRSCSQLVTVNPFRWSMPRK